jgi:hypothetical protein
MLPAFLQEAVGRPTTTNAAGSAMTRSLKAASLWCVFAYKFHATVPRPCMKHDFIRSRQGKAYKARQCMLVRPRLAFACKIVFARSSDLSLAMVQYKPCQEVKTRSRLQSFLCLEDTPLCSVARARGSTAIDRSICVRPHTSVAYPVAPLNIRLRSPSIKLKKVNQPKRSRPSDVRVQRESGAETLDTWDETRESRVIPRARPGDRDRAIPPKPKPQPAHWGGQEFRGATIY